MSQETFFPFTCSHCGLDFLAEVWTVINIDQNPSLHEMVQEGQLNVVPCDHCDAEVFVPTPVVYYDGPARRVACYVPDAVESTFETEETVEAAAEESEPEVEAEPAEAEKPEEEPEEDQEEQAEVDLGEFSVSAFQPVTNTTVRIDFLLYGTINADEKADFDEAWKDSTHRVRDQVIVTVRSCELEDLTDAGLGLIKRRILEKTNRTLGQPLLKSIVFSDFSFIEQ